MIQSVKQIKNRIRSVQNATKVTHAMEMISVAKLNQIDKVLFAMRPYEAGLEGIMSRLVSMGQATEGPLFEKRPRKERIALCVVASDSGLCGLYNHNILKAAEKFINKNGKDKVNLVLVGKKGVNYFKKKDIPILHQYVGLNGRYDNIISDEITAMLVNLFLSGKADEVFIAYTYFKTGFLQDAVIEGFLPILPSQEKRNEYFLEPDSALLIEKIAFQYLITKMRLIFLQAFTSEHATRSLAMKTATTNGNELLDGLVLLRNKVRQTIITQEMLEIISSTEVLKG
jgi:F-type H+-transporting ATPase subunit gamma